MERQLPTKGQVRVNSQKEHHVGTRSMISQALKQAALMRRFLIWKWRTPPWYGSFLYFL